VDSVQLAAGRCDLLDTELAELSLKLAELLDQLVLVLGPELDRLNLRRRHLEWLGCDIEGCLSWRLS